MQLHPLPRPYPYVRVGRMHTTFALPELDHEIDLLSTDLDDELECGLDFVLIGAQAQQDRIPNEMLDVIIRLETEGIPTVLVTESIEQLETPLAAVVSHLVTQREEVFREALGREGAERVFHYQPAVDSLDLLMQKADTTAEAAARREQIAQRSPLAIKEQFFAFVGLPAEPIPLVTVLLVCRKALHLDAALENLRRQNYARLDPVLVVDPDVADTAEAAVKSWDIPLRMFVSRSRSSIAERLNQGVQQAHGEVIAIFEEAAEYGPDYLADQLQALQYSGAHLVGKASWLVWNQAQNRIEIRDRGAQGVFDAVPALGTMVMYRETAKQLGFSRRASRLNESFAKEIHSRRGRSFVAHAFDTLLLKRGQQRADFASLPLEPQLTKPSDN